MISILSRFYSREYGLLEVLTGWQVVLLLRVLFPPHIYVFTISIGSSVCHGSILVNVKIISSSNSGFLLIYIIILFINFKQRVVSLFEGKNKLWHIFFSGGTYCRLPLLSDNNLWLTVTAFQLNIHGNKYILLTSNFCYFSQCTNKRE